MRLPLILALASLFTLPVASALAHSGGLDSLGCHHNRKAGGYHCHQGVLAGQSFGSKVEAEQALQGARAPLPQSAPAPSKPAPAQAVIAGRASVIDGDTLEIQGRRIRLHGIDAPESGQNCKAGGQTYRCGQKAALALADKIGQQTVRCDQRDTDRYGRAVAVCRIGAEDLGAWLALEGWALAYREFSREYVWAEDAAKKAGKGVWAGEFEAPWDWRRKRQQ